MVTKGIIKSIDLRGNTCKVHIPFFETAGNDPIIETATVSNTPGSYNGYKVGDVVYVAFEDGSMSHPVIVGKLYLGVETEKADPRGVINVEESITTKAASIPADTKLSNKVDDNVTNTLNPFGSLNSIATNLNKLNTEVAQQNTDYGNKLQQVMTDLTETETYFESKFSQTAGSISAEVSTKVSKTSEGESSSSFGWDLTSDEWTVYKKEDSTSPVSPWISTIDIIENGTIVPYYTVNGVKTTRPAAFDDTYGLIIPATIEIDGNWYWEDYTETIYKKPLTTATKSLKKILTANETGLKVAGTIEAEDGHIGSFKIGNIREGGHSSIHSTKTDGSDFITDFETNPTPGVDGIYLGTDGIKLGEKFSVDTTGNLMANKGTIGAFQIGDTHECESLDGSKASGIYSKNYIDSFEADSTEKQGIYLGTDGIKLGSCFSVDTSGMLTATGGTIGGFDINESSLSNTSEKTAVIVSPHGIELGTNGAFSVNPSGEIIATTGTFRGTIEASGAILTNVAALEMRPETNAVFDTITTANITSDNIITKSGYYFGESTNCGLTLQGDTVVYKSFSLSISSSYSIVGGGTSTRYFVTVTSDVPMTSDTTVEINDVSWETRLNKVTISGPLIIKAGSKSASKFTTLIAKDRFQIQQHTEIASTYDITPTATQQNPTGNSTIPQIISVSGNAIHSYSTETNTGTQRVTSTDNRIELNCNEFEMNGTIIVPSTGSFQVGEGTGQVVKIDQAGMVATGDITSKRNLYIKDGNSVVATLNKDGFRTNNESVILDSDGLTTTGKVKFKVGNNTSGYFEPVVRLDSGSSPNCFYTMTQSFSASAIGWLSFDIPPTLRGKVVSVVASGRYPSTYIKDGELKKTEPGSYYMFLVDWTTTQVFVYNTVGKIDKGEICILISAHLN